MIIKNPSCEDVPHLKALWKEAFGDTDEFINSFFALAFSKDYTLCAYDNESAVAVLYWFDFHFNNKKAAYIYGVATKKSHRGRGISTMLINKAHELLCAYGYVCTVLVPADAGLFNFYKKLGYKNCCPIDFEEHRASEEKAAITNVCAEEYLRLRKDFLPSNSLIFDTNYLQFLASNTDFYLGDNFIFAKSNDKNEQLITEFFGDKKQISSIISALGFKKAKVRSYGKSEPFCMYFPLNDQSTPPPEYIGFAFD